MKKSERPPINLANDEECVREGVRLPKLQARDISLWTKTPKEKKLLKTFRRTIKASFVGWSAPKSESKFCGTLIVHVKDFPKTTYTYKMCPDNTIQEKLDKFREDKLSHIIKAYWCGNRIL